MSDSPVAALSESSTDQAILSFIKKALAAQESLSKSPEKVFWYRGQANEKWSLLPGLFRTDKAKSLEDRAYREWVRRAELIEKPEEKEWQHLFNMQHYGVPTRLLDWTESFAVAVGFSLVFSNYGEKSIPRVFILDPVALNKKTTGRDRVFEIPADETLSYRQTYLDNRGIMPTGPVAVRPSSYNLKNRRADNQAGVFTIHDNSSSPLDLQASDIVTSFTIEKDDIPGARLFLKLSNVNPYTIYPDFGGLAGYIRAILTGENS
jgi:FRG domain